ncbi:hypothetical protein [Anaplasma phagocytophilum]|uniref:hypothetical protein n=1 Tax=Anaplasma phagocytophilum TaxID=948 RepID=UPI0031F952EE
MYRVLLLDKVRTLFTLLRLLKSLTLSSIPRFVVGNMLHWLRTRVQLIKLRRQQPKRRQLSVVVLAQQAV